MVQCSGLSTPTAGGMDSIFGWGTKIPQARGAAKKKEKKRNFLRGGQEKEDSTKDTRRNSEGGRKSTQRECQGKPSGSVIIRFDYI